MNGLAPLFLATVQRYHPEATAITSAQFDQEYYEDEPSLVLSWRADNGTEGGWSAWRETAFGLVEAALKELSKPAALVCGDANGQYKCNIHLGHEGKHMSASNGHVLEAW